MKITLLFTVVLMTVTEFVLVTNPALFVGDLSMQVVMILMPFIAIGLLMELRKA